MRIVKYKEDSLFDELVSNISENEKEKLGFVSMITVSTFTFGQQIWYQNYSKSFAEFFKYIEDSMSAIDKEDNIYKKLLRYLKLLKSNDKYESFCNTREFDYFKRLVQALRVNSHKRLVRTYIEMQKLFTSLETGSECEVIGDLNLLDSILTDELYEKTMNSIPRK